jgi:hypothetical protein
MLERMKRKERKKQGRREKQGESRMKQDSRERKRSIISRLQMRYNIQYTIDRYR